MNHLILLRVICEWHSWQGRAVATETLTSDPAIRSWSRSKFYQVMADLIAMDFVDRPKRGYYTAKEYYQHELNLGGV